MLTFTLTLPNTGSFSYAGGAGPLVGFGVDVAAVVGLGTPLNDGVTRTCVGCKLTLQTGPFIGSTLSTWAFAAGGSIALTGGIDLVVPPGSVLLSGLFTGDVVVQASAGTLEITGAAFSDVKVNELLDFYGLPHVTYQGQLIVAFTAAAAPPAPFMSTMVLSGSITNRQ